MGVGRFDLDIIHHIRSPLFTCLPPVIIKKKMNQLNKRIKELEKIWEKNHSPIIHMRDLDLGEIKGIKFARDEILKMIEKMVNDNNLLPEDMEYLKKRIMEE